MFNLESDPLYSAIAIYIVLNMFLFALKPKMFFDTQGKSKEWGVGSDKVIFPSFIITFIISVITFFFLTLHFEISD